MNKEKEFVIEIEETLMKIIEGEDFNIVRKKYNDGEYVLSEEDIYAINIFSPNEYKPQKINEVKSGTTAIIETLSKRVKVYASSLKEAINLVIDDYNNEIIELDYDDFVSVEFE